MNHNKIRKDEVKRAKSEEDSEDYDAEFEAEKDKKEAEENARDGTVSELLRSVNDQATATLRALDEEQQAGAVKEETETTADHGDKGDGDDCDADRAGQKSDHWSAGVSAKAEPANLDEPVRTPGSSASEDAHPSAPGTGDGKGEEVTKKAPIAPSGPPPRALSCRDQDTSSPPPADQTQSHLHFPGALRRSPLAPTGDWENVPTQYNGPPPIWCTRWARDRTVNGFKIWIGDLEGWHNEKLLRGWLRQTMCQGNDFENDAYEKITDVNVVGPGPNTSSGKSKAFSK